MPTDTEMLDWLQRQRCPYRCDTGPGVGVIFRWSETGRGWRLHETALTQEAIDAGARKDVRESIQIAMAKYPDEPTLPQV